MPANKGGRPPGPGKKSGRALLQLPRKRVGTVTIKPGYNQRTIAMREELTARRLITRLIGYHTRLAPVLLRRDVEQWTYNAARIVALRKALTLLKGTPPRK